MPTATQRPRIQLLLRLLRDRAGQWIPSQELANLGGPQFSVYIAELKMQGHAISQRIEHHGDQRLSWFRLNRDRPW